MSDTPETDFVRKSNDCDAAGFCNMMSHARRLERERDEAIRARDVALKAAHTYDEAHTKACEGWAQAERERDMAMKLFESGKRACASLNEALDKTLHELREAREQNAKLRDIAQKAIELAGQYYDGPCERDAAKLRAELDQLKEGAK